MQEILPECRVWYALMHELLSECRVWYAGATYYPCAGCGCRRYYPSAESGIQDLIRVQGVVCRSLPECRVWYAGAITQLQSLVCRS